MDENEKFLHFTVILVFQGLYLMLLFLSIYRLDYFYMFI